jgi:hypothetical protein
MPSLFLSVFLQRTNYLKKDAPYQAGRLCHFKNA